MIDIEKIKQDVEDGFPIHPYNVSELIEEIESKSADAQRLLEHITQLPHLLFAESELITRLEAAERGLSTYTEMYNRVYDELEAANQEIERLEWIISLHPAINPSVLAMKETK